MKKMFKKVLTTAFAAVMALSAVVAVNPSVVKADDVVADFSLADADWSYQVWGAADDGSQAAASTVITGAGSYSMTLDTTAGAEGAAVFVIDIPFTVDVLKAQNYAVSELKLTVDGTELALDTTKIVYGDIEEKGNLRIELFNQWGPTAVGEKYDAAVTPFDPATLKSTQSIKVDFTLVESAEPAYDADGKAIKYVGLNGAAATPDTPVEVPAFDPAGKYNAYFGLQSPSWTYRDAWNHESNGLGSANWGQWVINNDSAETYGVVTDAKIAGNGTYSVTLKDFGDVFVNEFANNADGLDKFRILMITTDIPVSEQIKITDAKLILDGKTVKTYKEAFLDPDSKDYVKILLQNEWNPDLKETLPFYNAPSKSIELKFTIEGFNYDNEDQKEDTTTKAPTTTGNDNNDGGLDPVVIAVIVVAVIAIVAGAVVVLGKKNKKN